MDAAALREVCGRFLTGVAVITCQDSEKEPMGLTANSFTCVSLDPPLVLFCLHGGSRGLSAIRESGSFAVNILAADQAALCRAFARRDTAGFDDLAVQDAETGAPVLTEALAYLDCRLYAMFPGGDHEIVVGEVVDLGLLRDAEPLAFFRSAHPRLEVPA
ncbi:flavin reductase family protein [Streptomyces sp. NPDC056486]|uniref:flavin reductase family protein n=1 Tax=Streptomyces sp. NPDC056486 TaxID=3345835 RepID=UPI0036BB6A0D